MDYLVKKILINDVLIKLDFWDTAGQERFRSVIQGYYNESHAVILVFDLTNPKSFSDLKYWVQQINDYFDNGVIKFLLGNKCDLKEQIIIKKEDIDKFINDFNFVYYETSAKTNTNLEECFVDLATQIKEKFWVLKKMSFDANKMTVQLKDYNNTEIFNEQKDGRNKCLC